MNPKTSFLALSILLLAGSTASFADTPPGGRTDLAASGGAATVEPNQMPDMRTTDLDGDGVTGLADLGAFASIFFACGGVPGPVCVPGDYNCDGIAGLADLSIFAANFFAGGVFMIKCPPAATTATEPAPER